MKEKILEALKNSNDILSRTINKNNHTIDIIFCETLSNSSDIEKYIIKPIVIKDNINNLENVITAVNLKNKNINEAINDIFLGFTIIILDNNKIYTVETKALLDRSIKESDIESSLTGPKDSFIENFNINIGLIRKRIRNKNLNLEVETLGTESNTKVGIIYMSNLIDNKLLLNVKEKISNIKNDIIIDGGYIKEELSKKSFFPEINETERPDLAVFALLEGKICLVIDNSPTVLIIPTFFIDFFHTPDDYYQKNINTTFIRLLRIIAFIIAIFLPGYYISITTYNPTSIPISLLLNIINQHKSVPFPAFFEIIIMIVAFEILRESDIRIPSKVGSSASILGGLILGEAAVSAGIISPIMIIVVAISSISALVFPYNSIINLIRYYRFLALLLSVLFGLFGLFISISLLIINISEVTSFGYPYTYPFVPLIKNELLDSFIKIDNKKERNPLLTKKRNRIWK